MTIVLVRPPVYAHSLSYPGGPRFGLPLSILYLAAALRQEGRPVRLYDALVDFDLAGLSPNEEGHYHIGAPWPRMVEMIAAMQPSLVGFTNPFSDFAAYTNTAIAQVKARLPHVPIVVGGPHATAAPDYFFREGQADFAVRGEGEVALLHLVQALEGNRRLDDVPGLSWKRDGQIVHNAPVEFIRDLDQLPFPAYDLVPMERYFQLSAQGFPSRYMFEYPGSHREVSLITSRGCPFKCVFCGNFLHMGRKWRAHSVDYVIAHMELLIQQYRAQHFHIEDDNLSLDPLRLDRFLDTLIAKKWGITWDTPNGIRADRLSEQAVAKLKASGCTYIVVGIESGNQRVLDQVIHKKLSLADVETTAKRCKKGRVDMHAFYIVGFPGESVAEMKDTFAFATRLLRRYDVIPHLGLARPLPGTALYDECAEKGYLSEPILPDIGAGVRSEIFMRQMIQTDEFSPQLLERLVNRFNRQVAVTTVLKALLWVCTHPRVVPRVLAHCFRYMRKGLLAAAKRVFFGGLFYKYNYLNDELWRGQDNRL
jgi:anaerobic magnesium-protoporphyrin IX monomethyl ester cyclase